MKHAPGNVLTIAGITLATLLLLLVFVFFFGRQFVKQFLPQSFGKKFFPPLATRIEIDDWQLFTPPGLPTTPSSILRAVREWATDRNWDYGHCERLSFPFQASLGFHKSPESLPRIYDDTDYATCLRYLFPRSIGDCPDNTMPGQWLPGRLFGEQAKHNFETILARRSNFFFAAYLLGCWHRQNGDTKTATQYFEQSYATAPVVLVMSFERIEHGESWEQNRPPVVTLVNNRTFAHNIDLTYHYGVDDCATVRYPLLQADKNGLVFIPAEADWLTWERTLPTGQTAAEQPNHNFDTSWRFRGQSKVAILQHVEMVFRPYDTNPIRTNPFFEPFWGQQQSLGIYERVALYCESQNESSLLFDRQILNPLTYDMPTFWQRGKISQEKQVEKHGFVLTEMGTIRSKGGVRVALIDSCDPRLLTWYLQQTGLTRDALIAKMRTWHTECASDNDIVLPQDMGHILLVVDCDSSAWLVKLAPVLPSSYMATTLRVGSVPYR